MLKDEKLKDCVLINDNSERVSIHRIVLAARTKREVSLLFENLFDFDLCFRILFSSGLESSKRSRWDHARWLPCRLAPSLCTQITFPQKISKLLR